MMFERWKMIDNKVLVVLLIESGVLYIYIYIYLKSNIIYFN